MDSIPSGDMSGMETMMDFTKIHKERVAHGVLMIIAFVVIFPLAALFLRLCQSPKTVMVHGALQLFALVISVAGLGLGVSLARNLSMLNHYHSIIGMAVVGGLAIFQPVMGILQHRRFRLTGKKEAFSLHVWFGRIMLILGAINVGLGFRFVQDEYPSDAPWGAVITVSVVMGIIGILYIVVIGLVNRAEAKKITA